VANTHKGVVERKENQYHQRKELKWRRRNREKMRTLYKRGIEE